MFPLASYKSSGSFRADALISDGGNALSSLSVPLQEANPHVAINNGTTKLKTTILGKLIPSALEEIRVPTGLPQNHPEALMMTNKMALLNLPIRLLQTLKIII